MVRLGAPVLPEIWAGPVQSPQILFVEVFMLSRMCSAWEYLPA
jgi:hypothetical protein